MNTQPYGTPWQRWEPRMSPWWVRVFAPLRRRTLYRQQRIKAIEVKGLEPLQQLLKDNTGVLITPNHSFHYDSYCLMEAADRAGRAFHFLTAWQVFAMSSRFERWSLQRHGCFSIDREGTDLQAFKQAMEILQSGPHPLVVFPEGDIYHTNDRLTPFRDGAAAIALGAARRAERRIVCVPCALKCWYAQDPMASLLALMEKLEQSVHWRPRPDLPLTERIHRFADGLLVLKELEYLGTAQRGALPARTRALSDTILGRLEKQHGVTAPAESIPERVKEVRRRIIKLQDSSDLTDTTRTQLRNEMDDLFFVIQLYSYPGDYVAEKATTERLAETLDKFEEDVLKVPYPAVRADRRVTVQFGEPIEVPRDKKQQPSAEELTQTLEKRVQGLLDQLSGPAAASGVG